MLNIKYFLPILVVLGLFFHNTIRRRWKFIVIAGWVGFFLFFAIDPLATHWEAWSFDYSQTLNIRFGKSVLEELVWGILVMMISAAAVAILMERKTKK